MTSLAAPQMPLSQRLAAVIAAQGPIPVAHFMAVATTHYYATRDPIGAEGDFTTAPEISQMFGEMVGLWFADLWIRMGKPDCVYAELGPGRGTLAADALRAMAMVGLDPEVHLVETSPVLKAKQAERLATATWHESIDDLPKGKPLLIVANEFFDCLPVHQIVRGADGWYQRMIGHDGSGFTTGLGKPVPVDVIPEALRREPEGAVIETSPACVATMRSLAQRVAAQGGIAAIIDYGYDGPRVGETVQAVSRHAYANPFEDPGERDVTAHVDFETLAAMAELCDARVQGPVAQGLWLKRLGIAERASALAEVAPDQAEDFASQLARLTKDDAMGRLFRVLAVRSPLWPEADGFGGGAGAG